MRTNEYKAAADARIANLIVSMMESGWEAADADEALKAVPAWVNAPCHAVDELARAAVREWDRVMEKGPVHEVWQFRASVARSWAEYREQGDPGRRAAT